jgi:hypothetical protein
MRLCPLLAAHNWIYYAREAESNTVHKDSIMGCMQLGFDWGNACRQGLDSPKPCLVRLTFSIVLILSYPKMHFPCLGQTGWRRLLPCCIELKYWGCAILHLGKVKRLNNSASRPILELLLTLSNLLLYLLDPTITCSSTCHV